MENIIIPLSKPEEDKNTTLDNPRTLALDQAVRQRDESLEKIRIEEETVKLTNNIINVIESDPFVPTIIMTIEFMKVKYDLWTSYATVEETCQYSMRTFSIIEAIQSAAMFLDIKRWLEPELRGLEMAIGSLIVRLVCPDGNKNDIPEWQLMFLQTYHDRVTSNTD
jgi:hypothetical protein